MAGAFLLPNIPSHSWLNDLMPKTLYNDDSCCENTTQILEGKDILAKTAENREKISVLYL